MAEHVELLLARIDFDAPARALASVGIPAGTAHFVFAMFAAVPISWAIPHIPTATGRHLYCALTGIFLTMYSYGWDSIFLAFATVVSYILMLTSRCRCGPVSWVFGVGFLLAWCGARARSDTVRPAPDLRASRHGSYNPQTPVGPAAEGALDSPCFRPAQPRLRRQPGPLEEGLHPLHRRAQRMPAPSAATSARRGVLLLYSID